MKTPDKDRKAAERSRMRALGYVLRQLWVHPLDWPKVSAYISRINAKRRSVQSNAGDA